MPGLSLLGALADLVLPRTCAGCGVPGPVLCPPCALLLTRPRTAVPRRFPWGFPPTVAAGGYAGPVRPTILAVKERARGEPAVPPGAALGLAAEPQGVARHAVVERPPHRVRHQPDRKSTRL